MRHLAHVILTAGILAGLAAPAATRIADANTNFPVPENCTVPSGLVVSPDASLGYAVTVVGSLGPMNGALVTLQIPTAADALVTWCVGQTHPEVQGVSDVNGQATFHIAAGGCVDAKRLHDVVYRIYADGILIGEGTQDVSGTIVSPDAVNGAGLLPTSAAYVPDGIAVSLSDAVFRTNQIANATPDPCTDFNSDGVVSLADAVILTPFIVNAVGCSP